MPYPAYNPLMQSLQGVTIWSSGLCDLARPLTPQSLADVHPVWARDVSACSPWRQDGELYFSEAAPAGPAVCVCGECSSALDVARYFCEARALPVWGSVLAVDQWAGRGQLRRRWHASPGDLMAAWRWPKPPQEWEALTPLMAGYCLARELNESGVSVSVKWPNDLMVGERKVGGVLVEERGNSLLVGVGLNLHTAPSDDALRDDMVPRAASLEQGFAPKSIISWWRTLVNRTDCWYQSEVSGDGPAHFLDTFSSVLAWMGREVSVRAANGVFTAFVSGLAPDGGLRLVRNGREEILYSGSICPL